MLFKRRLINKIKNIKFILNKSKYRNIPIQHLGETPESNLFIISQFIETKLLPITGHSPFPLNEQVLIVSTICKLRPSHIFEWGTNIGVSARLFFETCVFFGIKCEIHSIDLPNEKDHIEHPKLRRGELVSGIYKVKLHQGDGAETSLMLIKNIPTIERPLFFLDGDHKYSSVVRELEMISNNIPNASFMVHDTFYQTSDSGYNIGPHKAVMEFLEINNDDYIVHDSQLGLPGITCLIKKI